MSSVNTNFTNSHRNVEARIWDNTESRHQTSVRKPRNWVDTSKLQITNSNASDKIMEHNSSEAMKNVNKQSSSKKKTNWYKLSEFTNSERENSAKEKHVLGKWMGSVPNGYAASVGNFISSREPQNSALSSSHGEKNTDLMCSQNQSVNCTSDEMTNATVFIAKDSDNNIPLDIEEKRRLRRERQKMKKETKKQEKAIQREEEMRKKRLAPKDQKVTIIDHSTLDRLLMKDPIPSHAEAKGSTYNGCEFPALGEITPAAGRSNRNQKKRENSRGKSNTKAASSEKQSSAKSVGMGQSALSETDSSNQSTILTQAQTTPATQQAVDNTKISTKLLDDKSAGKRPKRRDLIHLDINEILKVQETKQETPGKQQVKKIPHKAEVVRYSGNILDSDNPERKRGKQREVPKPKTPSNLKQIILQERAKRKEARLNDPVLQKCKSDNLNIHLSNDGEQLNTNDLKLFNECEVDYIETQKKFTESKENELEVHTEICILKKDSSLAEDSNVPLQQKNVVTEESINNKESKNSEIYQNQSESVVTQETCEEITISEKNGYIASQPHPQPNGTIHKRDPPTRKLHTRKFREYCDHCVTADILSATTALLEDIIKFHDRQFARSPLKASAKRRHVTGLKEVRRFLALRRVRLLVIAPDLELSSATGGLDDLVAQLKQTATANGIPYVFALGRRQLGYILKKKVPVSCVGVLNYDGTEHNFRNLMSAVEKSREDYKLRVAELSPENHEPISGITETEETSTTEDDVNKEVVASLLAKLSTLQERDSPSPFLEAIERCNTFGTDSGEDSLYEE